MEERRAKVLEVLHSANGVGDGSSTADALRKSLDAVKKPAATAPLVLAPHPLRFRSSASTPYAVSFLSG